MPPPTRLIAIDIDGTLLPSAGTRISARNCAALCAAEAAGVEVVIATGRRQGYAMPLMSQVGLGEESVMISSNGAVTRTFAGELLDRRALPVETARRLCGEMRSSVSATAATPAAMVFTFDREGPGGLVIEDMEQLHVRIERWVEANRPYLLEIKPLERAFDSGEAPIQGMVCGTVAEMREAEARLMAGGAGREVAIHRTEYAARDLSILDLLPVGVSKGTALAAVARERGLEAAAVMAIGDNLNDLEMLEYAGRAVVMANSPGEMLTHAAERGWERAASNDDDGVARVIERLLREQAGHDAGHDAGGEPVASSVVEWAQ